ncbi:hypothetical protein B0O80DRAFT_428329 [Mortierella sp. GBAus27b]|nr:hypothetical protein B0O80DRAFT_428329 [Mortierella sp. GBAus27b]
MTQGPASASVVSPATHPLHEIHQLRVGGEEKRRVYGSYLAAVCGGDAREYCYATIVSSSCPELCRTQGGRCMTMKSTSAFRQVHISIELLTDHNWIEAMVRIKQDSVSVMLYLIFLLSK